jgi:hypothetical protein
MINYLICQFEISMNYLLSHFIVGKSAELWSAWDMGFDCKIMENTFLKVIGGVEHESEIDFAIYYNLGNLP